MRRVPLPWQMLQASGVHFLFDDFDADQSDVTWIDTVPDSGTALVGDAAGGIMALTASDGTVADNDEVYLESANETFLVANDKPLHFMARCQYAEANTDDANVFIGITDAVGANLMVDDGAGPKTSGYIVGFFKVDGGTNWNIVVSVSTTQTKVELTAANSLTKTAQAAGGASYQLFEAVVLPRDTSKADVEFFIDGKLVYKVTDWTYTTATEVQIGLGIKNGGANNEVLNVDFAGCAQVR